MKKFRKFAYVILIVVVIVLSLTIYTNASKNNDDDEKQKIYSEVEFFETKIINLFNSMNNIESRNYNIAVGELSKESTEKTESEGSSQGGSSSSSGSSGSGSSDGSSGQESGGSGGESSGGGSSKGGSGDSNSSSGSNSEQSSDENKKNKKVFELKSNSLLTNSQDINWDNIKTEVEKLYTSLPTITIDLYQLNANQEEILSFNKEFDSLTIAVKNENKEETLSQLSKIYDYMPKFIKNLNQEELNVNLVETKANILKAYSKLDSKDWQDMNNDLKNAIDTYSKLMSNTSIDKTKQYNINKAYVMLNELQNATNEQDETVFLIKYKNLIDEINNI